MSEFVQTKCGCGHSKAAHERGPCQGIDVFGTVTSTRAISLCECPGLHDTYTVPAAQVRSVSA